MAKLQYIDHSKQHPVSAFYDFVSTCFERSGFICRGGFCTDADTICSFNGKIYSNFKENADKYGFPLSHLLLSFKGENEKNISVYELIKLSDVLANVNGTQSLYRAIYLNDTGAEIHLLMNPVGFDSGIRPDLDQLYVTLWYCLKYFFDRPDLWDGHISCRWKRTHTLKNVLIVLERSF